MALDIQFADTKQIEARLWDVHSKINALYRERLRKVLWRRFPPHLA